MVVHTFGDEVYSKVNRKVIPRGGVTKYTKASPFVLSGGLYYGI